MNSADIMALADDFVKGFYAGDIRVITPPDDMKSIGDSVMDKARSTAHALIRLDLGTAIHKHVTAKSIDTAYNLVRLITSARNQGMIVESESYISKSKRLEQENIQLKEETAKLQKQVEKLTKLNHELQVVIDGLVPKRNNGAEGR